jgi:hypothetical protein
MQEVLVNGGQLVFELRVQILDNFLVALHGISLCGDLDFSTTINAIPEKAKDSEATFDIVSGIAHRAACSNKKAGFMSRLFDSRDSR